MSFLEHLLSRLPLYGWAGWSNDAAAIKHKGGVEGGGWRAENWFEDLSLAVTFD